MVLKNVGSATIQVCCLVIGLAAIGLAQSATNNNPYSPSPANKEKTIAAARQEPARATFTLAPLNGGSDEKMTGFGSTPTLIYRVGIGDSLHIAFLNSGTSADYTVKEDGTIDFPLATKDPIVAGQTVD